MAETPSAVSLILCANTRSCKHLACQFAASLPRLGKLLATLACRLRTPRTADGKLRSIIISNPKVTPSVRRTDLHPDRLLFDPIDQELSGPSPHQTVRYSQLLELRLLRTTVVLQQFLKP